MTSELTHHSSLVTYNTRVGMNNGSAAPRLAALGLLAIVGVGLLLPRLVLFADTSATFIAWPWQFDYAEGVNLSAVMQLAGGANIYRHNDPDAFISAPYPPVFYLLATPFAWMAGPSFGPGRALSLLATLAIALLLIYVVGARYIVPLRQGIMGARYILARTPLRFGKAADHHQTQEQPPLSAWVGGLLSSGLWLSLSPVIVWAALYEQNMVALAFGLAGVAWVLAHPGGRHIYIGALFFALAIYTKQSAVDAAAATSLWLLIRDPRNGLRFVLGLAAMVAVPFALANWLLSGGLWEHLVANQTVPSWSDRRFGRTLGRLWGEHWSLILLGVGGLVATLAAAAGKWKSAGLKGVRSTLATPWGLAALYSAIAGASVLARIGRAGINFNHLLDLLLPLCLLLGLSVALLFGELEPGRPGDKRLVIGGLALTVVLFVAQVFTLSEPTSWYRGAWPSDEVHGQMRGFSEMVGRTPGDIYSEDAYLLLSNGKRVLYDDAFMFVNLANAGRWDSSVFEQSLRDRRFALMFLQIGSSRWTEGGAAAFADNYDLRFPDFIETYAPKQVPTTPQYRLDCSLSSPQSSNHDAVSLGGYSLAPGVAWTGVTRGEVLRLALYWQPQRPLERDYASYAHVVNEQGERVSGQDNPSTGASQPTSLWGAQGVITDTASMPIPPDTPPGRYRLVAGMYLFEGGAINPLVASCADSAHQYGDAVSLGWVEIKGP